MSSIIAIVIGPRINHRTLTIVVIVWLATHAVYYYYYLYAEKPWLMV